jgi:importin subunit alpha-6/7
VHNSVYAFLSAAIPGVGTKEQISAVIESGCIDPIVNLLKNGELEIKREAAWAISNATSGGDPTQIQQLVQYGCIPPLCELLRVMDPRVVQVLADSLHLVPPFPPHN